MQLLELNFINLTLMHKNNYIIFEQMSISTHNNTKSLMSYMNEPRLPY